MRVTVGDSGFCCCTCVRYFERKLAPLLVDPARALCFRLNITPGRSRVGLGILSVSIADGGRPGIGSGYLSVGYPPIECSSTYYISIECCT